MTALRNCESYHATYAPPHGESVDPEDENDGGGKWEKLGQTQTQGYSRIWEGYVVESDTC